MLPRSIAISLPEEIPLRLELVLLVAMFVQRSDPLEMVEFDMAVTTCSLP
jgi:hypothetical protein